MISFKELSEKASPANWNIKNIHRKTWMWIGLGLAALPALRIYYVQEMLAALIGFSVLFVMIYIAVFAVFVLVRAGKPVIESAAPTVGRAAHWSVEAAGDIAQDVIASPVWAKAASLRPKGLPVWAKAAPAWVRAVPGWARTVPGRFRSQGLKLNENYKAVYSRVARLGTRPSRVYRATLQTGLQKGGAALTAGLRTQKRISRGLGIWLTQRVTPADFIRLRSRSRVSSLRSRTRARGQR